MQSFCSDKRAILLKLNAKVKVIIAGRYALIDRWIRGGWHSLVRNIELKPLSSTDVQAYASIRGIHGGDMIESLIRFSHGVPLALSMACEIMIRKGKITFLDQPQEQEMIGYLAAQLTNHIGDDTLIQYLEAGSSVWKFDQELLQALLQEQIPTNRFREFYELPFVSRFERYWTIHDAIRQWIFMDLRSRKPQTFKNYRERALQLLQKKEIEQSIRKSEFAFEKLYLHEDDVVRRLSFQWDDRLIYRECTMQDRDNVEQLYQKFIIRLPFYVPPVYRLMSVQSRFSVIIP